MSDVTLESRYPRIPRPCHTSARRNSFVKPEELDASDHEVKTDDHVITRRNRLVDLSISIKALYNCTATGSSVPILGTNVSIWGDSTVLRTTIRTTMYTAVLLQLYALKPSSGTCQLTKVRATSIDLKYLKLQGFEELR